MNLAINWLAVVLAAVATMVVGATWYSPKVFGKVWLASMRVSQADIAAAKAKGMGKSYFMAFVFSLVQAYVLAHLLQLVAVVSVLEAWQLAFWLWLGLVVPVLVNTVLWEGRAIKIFWINIAHYLAALLVSAAILFWL